VVAYSAVNVHDYGMNIYKFKHMVFFGTLVVFFSASAPSAQAVQLFTLSGFVDHLIHTNVIDESNSEKARELVALINLTAEAKESTTDKESENVQVTASQYIENSALRFSRFSDIEGLLLLVENPTNDPVTLWMKRGCPVTYTISSETDEILYDSAQSESCTKNEKSMYVLNAFGTRLFEVDHTQKTYSLGKGTYMFTLTYEGYGSAERVVEIY
jgi:hypothetical protein